MPHQDDRFPGLTEARAKRIQEDLEKRFPSAVAPIPWERWEALKGALATYEKDAAFLRSFLNKGQIAQVDKVAKHATRLRAAFLEAEDAGLGIPVEQAIAPLSIQGFHDLLAQIELRLRIEHKKDFLPDTSRRDLYRRFERWWTTTTGVKADIQEGWEGASHPTPFMYVANEVFNLPGMPGPTGASYKSLKDLQREIRNERRKIEEFGAALRAIQDRGNGEQEP